jgi:hypothetical protein
LFDVIDNETPLPPRGQVATEIGVSGARTVNLIFSIPAMDADVHWSVQFGPTRRAGYSQTQSGTFAARVSIALSLPVFGPALLLLVNNRGPRAHNVQSNV